MLWKSHVLNIWRHVFYFQHLFSTHNNTSAQVYKMVNSGSGVWLAIRNSPVIRLFHAKTGEHLEDYDISTVVHHLFTGEFSGNFTEIVGFSVCYRANCHDYQLCC